MCAVLVLRVGDHIAGADKEVALHEVQAGADIAIGACAGRIVDSRTDTPAVLERMHVVLDATECARAIAQSYPVMRLEAASGEAELAHGQSNRFVNDVALGESGHLVGERLDELAANVHGHMLGLDRRVFETEHQIVLQRVAIESIRVVQRNFQIVPQPVGKVQIFLIETGVLSVELIEAHEHMVLTDDVSGRLVHDDFLRVGGAG